jgi:Flp pilus assembly protein TadG
MSAPKRFVAMCLRRLKSFAKDRSGNFTMVAAISIPTLFAAVAMAVDITNVVRMGTELQDANDTAVLYAARHFQTEDKLPTNGQAEKFIEANYEGDATNVMLSFDKKTNEFTLTSEASFKPYIMGMFNRGTETSYALSKATLGVSGILEFALALDTTESMKYEGRMDGLKAAARNFVTMLYDVKDQGGDVRGAIVPFSRYVNVGVSRRKESWMDVPADIDTRKTERQCTTNTPTIGWTNCRTVTWPAQTINHPAKPSSCWMNDGVRVCNSGSAAWTEYKPAGSTQKCDPIYGTSVTTCNNVTTGRLITWHGCVGSRDYPYNVTDVFQGRKFPGLLDVTCADELMTLSDNRSMLLSKINNLTPADNTYIPEGVMWGMRTLTAWAPFTDGRGPSSRNENSESATHEIRKALIIMTDGANTLSTQGAWHTGGDVALSDKYMLEACEEAKSQNLEVYTIAFGSSMTASIKALLDVCATDPEMSFVATDATALNEAFKDIADQLLAIRLTE